MVPETRAFNARNGAENGAQNGVTKTTVRMQNENEVAVLLFRQYVVYFIWR